MISDYSVKKGGIQLADTFVESVGNNSCKLFLLFRNNLDSCKSESKVKNLLNFTICVDKPAPVIVT